MSEGSLKIQTFMDTIANPVNKARVQVTLYDENNMVTNIIEAITDESGIVTIEGIKTPPLEFSLNEYAKERPYGLCDVLVQRNGYSDVLVQGCQLFGDEEAIQPIRLGLENRSISTST